jgi:RND family efflux transporter MFP subunit
LVNHLKQMLGVQHVVLARFQEKNATTISAISDVEIITPGNAHNLSLRQCMAELRGQARMAGTVGCTESVLAALSTYRQLSGADDAVYLPMMVQDQPIGGMLIGGDRAKLQSKSFEEIATFLSAQVSPILSKVQRADHGIVYRLKHGARKFVRKNSSRKAALALTALMFVALCPIPHRVSCKSELQPVLRRFVAAPFEGVLNSVQVKCGDVVQQDQLLAVMDGNNLRMELAGLQAQLAAAQKKRDSMLAQANIAESQIAKSEAKRHESQIGLIQSRLDRLEIRSPISGVIVSGDMDKVEGARMEMGQSLFEVAPLESMQVEVQIPEIDSRHVRSGQAATLKFNSYPFQKWSGPIARVHPRSELVDDSNVFIAEVLVANQDGSLRPGMKGHASITTGWRPVAWIWLHHAWERMRYAFVW